jgi:acyl-coenzyme A synthetase/AMP-(fatty) acid ligase
MNVNVNARGYGSGSLRERLVEGATCDGAIHAAEVSIPLREIAAGTALGDELRRLVGRSVLIVTAHQLAAALALLELDSVARRIVLCPPDLRREYRSAVIAAAEVDAIVSDCDPSEFAGLDVALMVRCGLGVTPCQSRPPAEFNTEWVLLTSGTTGVPKLVTHTLAGLTAAIRPPQPTDRPPVWATFYDIRRYGGLQIFLRAVLGKASLVLSNTDEPIVDHLHRLATRGVTHLTGTPSHWRRALMSSAAASLPLHYVRLSGEIADQAILDSLRRMYPHAALGHAYASTEAGVGFEVTDGLEGFPARLVEEPEGHVRIKVVDGVLHVRSVGAASRYLGAPGASLVDAEGFVDTGDIVERRGNRYYFVGRRGGIINVGGLKVHPEEVEAIINQHGSVMMSRVRARKSPVMGAVVVADVVLHQTAADDHGEAPGKRLEGEILQLCRASLPAYKVPAFIRFVPTIEVTLAGKLARNHA